MANIIKTSRKNTVDVQLFIFIIREGNYYISFCPALNLSSFGDSEKEAKKGFEEAVKIFLEDVTKRGNLEKVLLDLGWKLQKLPTVKYTPPSVQSSSYYPRSSSKKFRERISIPVH